MRLVLDSCTKADSIYKNVALGHRNYIDTMIFLLILIAVFVLFAGVFVQTVDAASTAKIKAVFQNKVPDRVLKTVVILATIGGMVSTLYVATAVFVELELNASFQQRLTVLAPHIQDQEYKELQAEWASMQNRKDYETVTAHVEQLAQANNVVLPELLLP